MPLTTIISTTSTLALSQIDLSNTGPLVRTAVINKRAGGMGLILGRKCFKKPFAEGVELLHAVQDVYLDKSVTIA